MKNEDFILEVIDRILPDTSWHGESNHDDRSIKNIPITEDILAKVLDNIYHNSYVPEGNKGNWSFEEISKKKREIIRYLVGYVLDYTNKEDLDYICDLYGYELKEKEKE